MYTLPNKLKLFAIIFMVVGALGVVAGFLAVPSDIEEVKTMMASHEGDGHGGEAAAGDHGEAAGAHGDESHGEEGAHSGDAHYEHVLGQLQNKPWAAIYVAAFFFMMIALGALAFYAIQYAAQAGWSPVLFRVMEGITAYLPVGTAILFVLLCLSAFHFNHLFHWMDVDLINPESDKFDKLIAGKSGFLNTASSWCVQRSLCWGGTFTAGYHASIL